MILPNIGKNNMFQTTNQSCSDIIKGHGDQGALLQPPTPAPAEQQHGMVVKGLLRWAQPMPGLVMNGKLHL